MAFITSKMSAHTVVWHIPQQLKPSLFHFIKGVAVWRGVETFFVFKKKITNTSPKRHFLLMFGAWLFSEVQLCDSRLAKNKPKKPINEHISYFVAAGGVTQNLFRVKLVASFTFVLWFIRTVSGAILLFKGNRKAKIETCFPLMETWSRVLVHPNASPAHGYKHASTRPASQFLMASPFSFPAFSGWRLLALTWISFIFTNRH